VTVMRALSLLSFAGVTASYVARIALVER